MKKIIKKIKELSGIKKIILLMLFFLVPLMFGYAGYTGYYTTDPTKDKYIAESATNTMTVTFLNHQELWLTMPRACSEFMLMGIITPFTPPIPIFHLRSWHWGDSDCNYFTISTKPQSDSVRLITNNQTFEPEVSEGLYGYTKYKFPIKAKNIDSGTIIIEKDGEKIEIPFKYEYFKFWY